MTTTGDSIAPEAHPKVANSVIPTVGTANGVEWKVFNGEARDIMKTCPARIFDCIITSPPYYWLRDYGMENQIGKEETVAEYVEALCAIMDESRRVLKRTGVLFLNLGDTYYSGKGIPRGPDRKSTKRRFGLRAVDKGGGLGIGLRRKSLIGIPWRVATAMSQRGWILRSAIVWHREDCLPEAVQDRPRRSYEHVFIFAQSQTYFFDRQPLIDKNVDEDVWTIAARPRNSSAIDTAPYPDELVQRCLDIGCPAGGLVLDCFAGSGTTLRVAVESGRPAVGIELNPDFCKFIIKELRRPRETELCF